MPTHIHQHFDMSQLRKTLRPASSFTSPVMIVLLVIALQAALLGGFFYLASIDKLSIEPAEMTLLLGYCAVTIFLAIVIGIMRHRWLKGENRVRQRLLDVIDAIPDPSAVRDLKGKYIMWNKAAESYHGVKAEHVLGKTPFELFPKEVARSILELDAECARSNQNVLRRVVLPPLYGKGRRTAMIRVAPVHSATDTSIRGMVTILQDVTESEREASALRHLSTQLKMALDTSGFGSWIWDLEQDSVTYSAQYQALLRYKGTSFRQDFEFLSRVHPGDIEAVKTGARLTLKDNVAFDLVYRLQCFDGEYRYFHASGESALDDKGKRYFAGLLCPLDRKV
jgi:PAS domain S-box-containing protein